MFTTTCSASEDVRKRMRAGGTQVPWKDNFWCYFFILMKDHFYMKTISDIFKEMKMVYKQPIT